MKLTFSVIIPTYNRAPFLMEALRSVISQTRKPLEILVVDDGSTDNTRQALLHANFNITYMYQENKGVAAARNAGVLKSKGELLIFLDDDDIVLPQAFELAVSRLEQDQADMVYSLTMPAKNIKEVKGSFSYDAIPPVWPERLIGSCVMRADIFEKIGFFDEGLELGQDLDWHMRAKEKQLRTSYLSEITHIYRIHENNRSKKTQESQKFMLKVLKKSLSRREKMSAGIALPLMSSDFRQIKKT